MSLLILSSLDDDDALAPPTDTVRSYASMMLELLPPGRVWRLVASTLYDLFLGCAEELARIHQRVLDFIREANPATTEELIPEHEAELELESTGTTAERQARILAHTVANQRYRPEDFRTALAPLLGQLATDVDVIEITHAEAVAMGDVREIFRFHIFRDPGLPGTYYLDSAQDLVDEIKPSHTLGQLIESVSFLCDDPHSLCDRDLLGA